VRLAFSQLKLLQPRNNKNKSSSPLASNCSETSAPPGQMAVRRRKTVASKPRRRARLPNRAEMSEAYLEQAEERDPSEVPKVGTLNGIANGWSGIRVQRTKLPPKKWLRLSRILRVDELLKRKQLHFGTGRLLVLGLQIMEGLKLDVLSRVYIDRVRRLVAKTHSYYGRIRKGEIFPWGLNTLGKSLTAREVADFSRSSDLLDEIRCKPGAGMFRKVVAKMFCANLGAFLRLNNADLDKILARICFRQIS